ncbi:MAG: tetratricopeptide repeat protein, partial [Alphaproteobacteria bacterium]|nr:tetratricopeptide repeat protein [Alphaproteobacteria bacterium]
HVLSNFFDYPVNQIKKFNLIKTAVELGQIKINELIQDRAPIALVTEIKSIYIKAINKFAKMLKDGFAGNDPNLEEAAHLFLKVIKSDDAEQKDKASAMYYYGHLIKEGFMGQRPNKNMGNDFILKAAKSGCAAAMNHYGGFLMGWIDNDVEKNAAAAYRWFLKAAKAGDHASMSNVGEILWFGVNGVKQNRKEAKKWLYKAANAGYLDAMILLSRDLFHEAFEEGVSVEEKEKLLKEAAPLLCLANGSNYFDCLIRSDLLLTDEVIVKSQVRLDSEEKIATGLLLRDENTENDVLQNKDETESSNKPECKLASEVDLEGDRLLENKTIDHDLSQRKLKKIFRSKFELQPKDKVTALVNLAQLYFHGYVDGEKNIKKAFELLLPIAKNNYPEAMNYIGRLFLQETEEQKPNYKKAFKWFRGAAENGHVDSMVRLGSLILLSFDFSKNDQSLSDALFWFQKADSLGSNDAAAYLEICENLLKENAELDVTDEEISRFIEVNDVSNPNKSLHSLVMPSKIEDDIINEDKDDHVEIPQSDDSLINVVFSNDSINECKVTEPLDDVRINVQSVNNNPKFQREQLRRIGLLKKNQEVNYSHKILKLSAKNQLIVNMLLDRTIKFKNVDYTQLVNLFKDPFFENQVSVIKSKSGCVITAKNYKTLDYVAASTHKKHNKTYDGLNPFFARDLLKILALFGHTEG